MTIMKINIFFSRPILRNEFLAASHRNESNRSVDPRVKTLCDLAAKPASASVGLEMNRKKRYKNA